MSQSTQSSDWRPFLQLYVAASAFALSVAFWTSLSKVLGILVVAAFMAVALDAGIRTLQRLGLPRKIATLSLLGSGVVMVLAGLLIALPAIHREFLSLTRATPGVARNLANSDAWQWLSENTGAGDGLIRAAQSFVTSAPGILTTVISATVGTVFNLAMITLAVLFLLSSGSKSVTLMVRIAPGLATARGWDVVAETYQSIGRYVIGAVAQATIAGVVVAVMLTLVDVPFAIALGLVTFFWDFIPMIGSTIAAIPCVIVAYGSQGLETAIFVGIFITAFTQVENSILQPRIQGGAASLPGAAIFFSVLIGGTLFGISGAILAVPAASVISTILQHWFEHRGVATLEPPVLFDERGHVVRNET